MPFHATLVRRRLSFSLVRLLPLALCLVLWPGRARAIEYEVFIDVDDEEELYDLFLTQQITEQTFNDVLEVIRRGIDLNLATREELYALPNLTYEDVDKILAYRTEAGRIANPAQLVAADVISRRKAASIAAFLRVETTGKPVAVRGHLQYRTLWTSRDRRAPPMFLRARIATLRHLTFGGVALLDRNRLAPVSYDPAREGLSTSGPRTRPRVPKYYAQWETSKWGIIAGTYKIGFGQRLVFDTTGRYTPNGFLLDDTVIRPTDLTRECRESTGELPGTPCPTSEERIYLSPDYRIREGQGLRGAAVGIKNAKLPVGWLQAYGFFSHETRDIYQYAVWDRDRCEDPRVSSDDDPLCGAPDVFLRRPDPLQSQSKVSFTTLPNMYNEITSGGNVSYFHSRRTHVGVTGYGATTKWLVDGANLDFQDAESRPFGGPWGAVGADTAWGYKWADIFFEVAHSFDSVEREGGGGPAAILRHTATWDTHEIEASVRYYDELYANPYNRAISAADEFQGNRARDEVGGRLRYTGLIADKLSLRTFWDLWSEFNPQLIKTRAFARADYQAFKWWRPGLWFEYQTRDISGTGRRRCYLQGSDFDNNDASSFSSSQLEFFNDDICRGNRIQITGRSRFDPHKRVNFSVQYRHQWLDDDNYDERFRQDAIGFFLFSANPVDPLRIRTRLRVSFEDIFDSTHEEEQVWWYLQLIYKVRRWFVPKIRYDIRARVDNRELTPLRRPNPEHWVHFELESRF